MPETLSNTATGRTTCDVDHEPIRERDPDTGNQMREEPVKAAELVHRTGDGLSRYRTTPDTLTELSGWLEDVRTTGEDDAWIVVRPVDGLSPGHLAAATIRRPTAEIDKPRRST